MMSYHFVLAQIILIITFLFLLMKEKLALNLKKVYV